MSHSKEQLPALKIHLPCDVSVHPRVPDSCYRFNAIVTRDTFWAAFKMYGALFLFTSLIRGKGLSPRAILTRLLPSTFRSAAFLGVFASLYGAGNCLHVNLLGANLQLPYFLSAFFAAFFSILIEHRTRRSELMLYTCNVAAEAAFNMLVHRGWLKPVKHGVTIIFALSWSILLAMFRHSKEDMDSVKAAVSAMMGDEKDTDSMDRWIEKTVYKTRKAITGEEPPAESQVSTNPVVYSSIGVIRGFIIGIILKGGLTLVSLASKPHKVKKITFWKRESKLVMKMAFFLSILSGGSRALVHLIKKLRGGVDSPINSAIAGLISGSASILSGNVEVSMYLASKAANALVQLALRKAGIPTPALGAAFMYALATATIFYQSAFEPHNLRPSYWKFLIRVTNGHIHHFGVLAADYRRELGIPGPSNPVAPLKK